MYVYQSNILLRDVNEKIGGWQRGRLFLIQTKEVTYKNY